MVFNQRILGAGGRGELIAFSLNESGTILNCVALKGQTWEEYAASKGNLMHFSAGSDYVYYVHSGWMWMVMDVSPEGVIEDGTQYSTSKEGPV